MAVNPFAGRVAILGYGSLIWDLDDLAPWVEGEWRLGEGPELPLEFSRISAKRLGSLVVTLDARGGEDRPTHAILSRRSNPEEAAKDLARRERSGLDGIGVCHAGLDAPRTRDAGIGARIEAWRARGGAAGVVWAELPANFESETGRPFTVAAGLDWLRALSGPAAAEARRYIDGAPAATDTPLRRALARENWWRAGPR